MAQQRFRRHDDQRPAFAQRRLPAQHVEELRRRRRLADLDVLLGAQLQVAFQPGRRVFGPAPSWPCGRNMVNPLVWPHFDSPAAMKLSMTTWAPLAKSPNCASQITSASSRTVV